VAGLLHTLGLGDTPVLVELNGTALLPAEFTTTPVRDGDTLEIIRIVAGG
jgi:thiamine biosynthesis protein ThiS